MIKVALLSNTPEPAYSEYINYEFLSELGIQLDLNPKSGDYDYCIVHSKGLRHSVELSLPRGRLILITGEPKGIYYYSKKFLRQFDTIYTSRSDIKIEGANIIPSHPYQVPWIGRNTYKGKITYKHKLSGGLEKDKTARRKKICIITSDKVYCKGHLLRKRFVQYVLDNHSDVFDVYGFGYSPIGDKAEVLNSYAFTLAIENTIEKNYWTEKIHDAVLCGCFPFYYGAPNMNDYLSESLYQHVDISNPKLACAEMIQTVNKNEVKIVRDKCALDKYSLQEFIIHNCKTEGNNPTKRIINGDMKTFALSRLRLLGVRLFWKIKSVL